MYTRCTKQKSVLGAFSTIWFSLNHKRQNRKRSRKWKLILLQDIMRVEDERYELRAILLSLLPSCSTRRTEPRSKIAVQDPGGERLANVAIFSSRFICGFARRKKRMRATTRSLLTLGMIPLSRKQQRRLLYVSYENLY